MALHVTIMGAPVPQGRPRFSTRGGFPRAYDPAKSRNWKKGAAVHMLAARQAAGWPMLTGPVRLDIIVTAACPVSAHRKTKPVPRRRDTRARGDVDNLAKIVADAATGILYRDDRQVCVLTVEKWLGAQGEPARVEMRLEKVE